MIRSARTVSNSIYRSFPHRRTSLRPFATEATRFPKVNEERLWSDIHHTCQWGTGTRWGQEAHETGMSRLALSDADKSARDWFVKTTESLGCKVTVDAMGNTCAVRQGRTSGPPTCAGSHLDTQPSGGRYDGILGVCAGVEMLRALHENAIETEFPVGVINWTNEEGARFPMSMVSSGVWSGDIPLERAHGLKEVGKGGRTMREELERIGYLGKTPANYQAMPIAAHFELHIEQGPVLESKSYQIGVVEGVQAYKWFTIQVRGRECHTGTTPFANRKDAMLCASRLIYQSYCTALEKNGLASTGILTLSPGSVNTVPGAVDFSLDIRHPRDEILQDIVGHTEKSFAEEASRFGCDVTWQLDFASEATRFDSDCISCVRDAAEVNFGSSQMRMNSGAGHDSVFTSRRVPTAMIFVPCRNGVSHHPEEFCASTDCANGAQVLMEAVLRYDNLRTERAR